MHLLWRVRGFDTRAVERQQRRLAIDLGGDLAATSVTQMTRLPGFWNHKHREPYLVWVEYRDVETVYTPRDFPHTHEVEPGTTKNLEGRVFYLTPELRKMVDDQRKAAKRIQREKGMIVQHVFYHDGRTQAGEPAYESGQPISPSGFYHAWCRARVAAARPGSIPHDLRRTAVRNMVRAGIPERVAMKLSGHKTRSVFDRYNIVSDGDLRDAAKRLIGVSIG